MVREVVDGGTSVWQCGSPKLPAWGPTRFLMELCRNELEAVANCAAKLERGRLWWKYFDSRRLNEK